jgi:hypothetical protein
MLCYQMCKCLHCSLLWICHVGQTFTSHDMPGLAMVTTCLLLCLWGLGSELLASNTTVRWCLQMNNKYRHCWHHCLNYECSSCPFSFGSSGGSSRSPIYVGLVGACQDKSISPSVMALHILYHYNPSFSVLQVTCMWLNIYTCICHTCNITFTVTLYHTK